MDTKRILTDSLIITNEQLEVNAKRGNGGQYEAKNLPYVDILSKNQPDKNRALITSNRSIFRALHSKVSYRVSSIGLKKGGVALGSGIKYKNARLVVLKSINSAVLKGDRTKEAVLDRERYMNNLASKETLKYFLMKSNLPCNGQRTKTNARTCKRKSVQKAPRPLVILPKAKTK